MHTHARMTARTHTHTHIVQINRGEGQYYCYYYYYTIIHNNNGRTGSSLTSGISHHNARCRDPDLPKTSMMTERLAGAFRSKASGRPRCVLDLCSNLSTSSYTLSPEKIHKFGYVNIYWTFEVTSPHSHALCLLKKIHKFVYIDIYLTFEETSPHPHTLSLLKEIHKFVYINIYLTFEVTSPHPHTLCLLKEIHKPVYVNIPNLCVNIY